MNMRDAYYMYYSTLIFGIFFFLVSLVLCVAILCYRYRQFSNSNEEIMQIIAKKQKRIQKIKD